MLIAFIGVVFVSVAFQLHLVNRQVSRTLGEVHGHMLSEMYRYNTKNEDYDRETVKVIWHPTYQITSAHDVPRLGLFRNHLPGHMRIYSHWVEQHKDPDPSCGESPPCKRTKAGGGLNAGGMLRVALNSIRTVGDGDYLGWLWHNGENAALDVTGLRESLQELQGAASTFNEVMECIDDLGDCIRSCVFGSCPLDF